MYVTNNQRCAIRPKVPPIRYDTIHRNIAYFRYNTIHLSIVYFWYDTIRYDTGFFLHMSLVESSYFTYNWMLNLLHQITNKFTMGKKILSGFLTQEKSFKKLKKRKKLKKSQKENWKKKIEKKLKKNFMTLIIPKYKRNGNVSFKSEFVLPEPKKLKKRPPPLVQTYSQASGHHMEAI